MKNQKMYEADDKMISIIRDNYNILQSLGSFGINLGFGDKTVREVCDEQNVDTYTFLSVVNLTINGYKEYDNADRLSLPTLLHYLKASHAYYIDFQLPFIRKELVDALDEKDNLARLILKCLVILNFCFIFVKSTEKGPKSGLFGNKTSYQ